LVKNLLLNLQICLTIDCYDYFAAADVVFPIQLFNWNMFKLRDFFFLSLLNIFIIFTSLTKFLISLKKKETDYSHWKNYMLSFILLALWALWFSTVPLSLSLSLSLFSLSLSLSYLSIFQEPVLCISRITLSAHFFLIYFRKIK